MGTLVGHVAPGFGFLLLGLWHLFNHIKLHSLRPDSYTSPPWFPARILKHLELLGIMAASSTSIAMELFIGPENHQPLDPSDWSIPSNHLHNFEHSAISLSFLAYSAFALVFDLIAVPKTLDGPLKALTNLLAALAFAQQLLMFRLHSSDHMGVEGQYHTLLQLIVVVSLSTTLMGIGLPNSFIVSFVRSASVAFQGVWFIAMGLVLWTPSLVFKGCFMNQEDGHTVVRCRDEGSLHRAKSLVNIQFSFFLVVFVSFTMMLYLFLVRRYAEEETMYLPLVKAGSDEDDDNDDEEEDLEAQKKFGESQSFVNIGKGMRAIELER